MVTVTHSFLSCMMDKSHLSDTVSKLVNVPMSSLNFVVSIVISNFIVLSGVRVALIMNYNIQSVISIIPIDVQSYSFVLPSVVYLSTGGLL